MAKIIIIDNAYSAQSCEILSNDTNNKNLIFTEPSEALQYMQDNCIAGIAIDLESIISLNKIILKEKQFGF